MPINIICDHQPRPQWRGLGLVDRPLFLSVNPKKGNIYLEPVKLEASLEARLDPLSLDLCEIAAFVYMADKLVPRGRHEKWVRDLSFLIPVRSPARWNEVRTLLTHTVSTLSGDNVQFRFVKKDGATAISSAASAPVMGSSDCVSLFSGGLDSFAGTIHLVREGRRPLLASHYVSSLRGLQGKLVAALEKHFDRGFEHFQYRVTKRPRTAHTAHPVKTRESTHRARSFLFMSFAAAAAAVRGLSEIFICENGVLSLNVPLSEARKGTRSTRHAHPLYLSYFNQLIDALYQREFSVRNPFFYWTKSEEAELVAAAGLRGRIRDTVSCWGYPNLTIKYPGSNHCGACIPCLVRRVSTIAAGLEADDDRYVVDAFDADAALAPDQRRNVEDLVYFAESFVLSSKTELLYHYPELVMVEEGLDLAPGSRLEAIIDVYRRFAEATVKIAAERGPHLLRKDRQAA